MLVILPPSHPQPEKPIIMGLFNDPVSNLKLILDRYAWAAELAGILPLSALIDFIDIPLKLHVFQLTGAVPLWSWPVTPQGSRLLLSDQYKEKECYLDRYGSSMAFMALDGRYGDNYAISCPETVRLCLSTQTPYNVHNDHENMSGTDLRIQNLEFVHVRRLEDKEHKAPSGSWLSHIFLNHGTATSVWYSAISAIGWTVMLGMIAMGGILRAYLSLAFLAAVLGTGLVTMVLYGCQPRRLLVQDRSPYNRLVLVTEHMNSRKWTVFYGESTIVNSLLNRPLEPDGPELSSPVAACLLLALRILIIGQWALVIGSAALKSWDAYFITFWIIFCIFSHAYLIPPRTVVNGWMRSNACIQINRFSTRLSSRRALLNTLIALNPDTFPWLTEEKCEDRSKFDRGAMRWVDPILAPGTSRSEWEEATREALNEAAERYPSDETLLTQMRQDKEGKSLGPAWNSTYPTGRKNYWKPFVLEGIYMAAKLRLEAKAPRRMVSEKI